MLQMREGSGLAAWPLHNLECDGAFELSVPGLVNNAHAAAAQFMLNAVARSAEVRFLRDASEVV